MFTAQAADVRADNGDIVGAFVLKGEPKAWGLSKKGFCATISGNVTIGVANNTPLFEEATETEGYFSGNIHWSAMAKSSKMKLKANPLDVVYATATVRYSWSKLKHKNHFMIFHKLLSI